MKRDRAMRGARPSRSMLAALFALILAMGGQSAYAAATAFLLGTQNTESATTRLNGSSLAAPALELDNTSAAAGATPLGLRVATGHAPLAASSAVRVPNLAADTLDGVDSHGFVQGTGKIYANAVAVPDTPRTTVTITTSSLGLYQLDLTCGTIGVPAELFDDVQITNTSRGTVNFFTTDGFLAAEPPGGAIGTTLQSPGFLIYSVQGKLRGTPVVSTLRIGDTPRPASNDCHFQIHATTVHE